MPKKAKQSVFIVFSIIFLVMTDVLSAAAMGALTIITIGFGRASKGLRKKHRFLFILLTFLLIFIYGVVFVAWSYYSADKYGQAGSFMQYCPIGMAFFFLQGIRFTLDVFSGRIKDSESIKDTAAYLLFYPRLAMGPVQSYTEHKFMLRNAVICSERLGEGLCLFVLGLSKKLLIADTIGLAFTSLYHTEERLSIAMSWIKVLAFSLQFYFTVSGYGNMAKGIALCYGCRLPDSYRKPMVSGSLVRFAAEWNITVVSWCRLCFLPLLRNQGIKQMLGIMFTWMLLGLWYSPLPHMAVWGLWMGAWIWLHQYTIKKHWHIPSVFNVFIFIVVTFFGWTFFSADSFAEGVSGLMQLLGSGKSLVKLEDMYYIRSGGLILLIALCSATGCFNKLMVRIKRIPILAKAIEFLAIPVQLILFILCAAVLATQMDVSALQWKGALI